MEKRNDFRLNFITDMSRVKTLTIPRANPLALGAAVAQAMQEIIDSGVVASASGIPTQRYSAELVTTDRNDFDLTI